MFALRLFISSCLWLKGYSTFGSIQVDHSMDLEYMPYTGMSVFWVSPLFPSLMNGTSLSKEADLIYFLDSANTAPEVKLVPHPGKT